jgi:prepilin-type N-terminal cleavage/methylation domain-containing protein
MKTLLKTIGRILKRKRGFTLVEMVTVVAIMGVMTAIAVPMVSSQIGGARDKSYAQDKAMIQTVVDSFFTESNDVRYQGQRQYPIMGANSGADNSGTGGEDRSAEAPNGWVATDTSTNMARPLNPKRGIQGGEPKWIDNGDSNRSGEDNLNAEKESLAELAVGWYVTKVTHQGKDFAVDTRDYFIDFRKLVAAGLLQSAPKSASPDNGGGSDTGSYSWYVKPTGEVSSMFFHYPTNGTDINGKVSAKSEDLRGFNDGVYP